MFSLWLGLLLLLVLLIFMADGEVNDDEYGDDGLDGLDESTSPTTRAAVFTQIADCFN